MTITSTELKADIGMRLAKGANMTLEEARAESLARAARKESLEGCFAALAEVDVPADFLSQSERHQGEQDRDPFAGWEE
ncbi:hypothetical protein AGMMS50256_01550 [Betaproteobacteria bacterium]|nr:hypothetical protein AGMMS50256_01550 [Betaproteobacteria bacterium]